MRTGIEGDRERLVKTTGRFFMSIFSEICHLPLEKSKFIVYNDNDSCHLERVSMNLKTIIKKLKALSLLQKIIIGLFVVSFLIVTIN